MAEFTFPTQFTIQGIEIDGIDIMGKFVSAEIFENIYSPIITGTLTMVDTDGSNFVEQNGIEATEEVEIEVTNARDEQLLFKGYLNGIRNRVVKNQLIGFTFDFYSESVKENESTFITKKFTQQKPGEIIQEMIEKIKGKIDTFSEDGFPLEYIGSRKRPIDIIKYVITHGVTSKAKVQDQELKSQEGETSGTTGFLCWETLDGHRFASIDDLLAGRVGNDGGEFEERLLNTNQPMDVLMNSIIEYNFKRMGDIQAKLRSGSFGHINISMDIDKGLYKELIYKPDESLLTDKQKEALPKDGEEIRPSRILYRPLSNERFSIECFKAPDHQHDQSRKYLSQNLVRQNTFDDQAGSFTLPPQFKLRAGDRINVTLPKVIGEGEGGVDEKHSGRYILRQVSHHLFSDGRAYTQVKTIRSTIQKDEADSEKR